MQKNLYLSFVKPLLDRVMAFLLILITLPAWFLISILLFVIHQKVFFRQLRSGKNEVNFHLLKFYTINPLTGKSSGFQKLLRATSLDELPQLIHILQGKMSFVGPRPLLPEYNELYSPIHRKRSIIQPGLTGLTQVSGRNLLSWEKRLDLDIKYIQNQSFIVDFEILIKTFGKLFSHQETEPSKPFTGYD